MRHDFASGLFRFVTLPMVTWTTHILVRTDRTGQVTEADETNNDGAHPISVLLADLSAVDFSGPGDVSTGQHVGLSWTVRNDGSSWADALPEPCHGPGRVPPCRQPRPRRRVL